jgi:para-nitrobenzyl esterase
VIIETTGGLTRGHDRGGVIELLGIPFATAERFCAPVEARWDGLHEASGFGPIAPQAPGAQYLSAELEQSEQCLSLNVWTSSTEGRRPVMVWLHGGGFRNGASASPFYDGAPLARTRDVVVVTINYRLGALGFLAHPDLAGRDGLRGNWGLLDQISALHWVRANIESFGGDASNVTVLGESAGAASVCLLMVSPLARELFHKAIAQSGAPSARPLAFAVDVADKLAAALGVTVAGLRDVPLQALLEAETTLSSKSGRAILFTPVIDGTVIDGPPLAALGAGAAAGVPAIIGTNVDEWKLWAPTDRHSRDLTDEQLRRRLGKVLDSGVDEVVATYETARSDRGEAARPNDLWFAIESDRFFRVPALRAADAQAGHQSATYTYLFEWGSPAMGGWLGACHGLEIAFVFGVQGRAPFAEFTGGGPAADALSEQMMDAWTAFARTGNPSTPALPWPVHDPASRPTMVFGTESRVEAAPRETERAVVDHHLHQDPWLLGHADDD